MHGELTCVLVMCVLYIHLRPSMCFLSTKKLVILGWPEGGPQATSTLPNDLLPAPHQGLTTPALPHGKQKLVRLCLNPLFHVTVEKVGRLPPLGCLLLPLSQLPLTLLPPHLLLLETGDGRQSNPLPGRGNNSPGLPESERVFLGHVTGF